MSAPGKSDDEVILLLLHDVEEDLDRLLTVVLVVRRVVQVVRLVDQQDTSESLLDHFLRETKLVGTVSEKLPCHRDLRHFMYSVPDTMSSRSNTCTY